MKVIEYTDYELNDLYRFLDYAKDKKAKDYKDGKINQKQYQYELGLLQDLMAKSVVKSYQKQPRKIQKQEDVLKIM